MSHQALHHRGGKAVGGAGANLEKMEAFAGGHRKREGDTGRKEAFDAHRVCGTEYD